MVSTRLAFASSHGLGALPMALTMVIAMAVAMSCGGSSSPMDVPDPRPTRHVVDSSGTLDAPELDAIDAAAAGAAGDGELMVVVVDSTGGVEPRQWTTTLFNRLRLDTRERNRGVLLMAAIGDRKSEIVVGEGYPGDVTNITDDIMQNIVVAHFKSGDPRRAMVEGARAIATRVIPVPVPEPAPVSATHTQAPPSAEVVAALATAGPAIAALVDPRPASFALDRAHALTPMDVHRLNSMANVQISGGIDPLFVVVTDTGGVPARAFALALFERWLAPAARGRGVLALAITSDKTVEIVAGAGFPSVASSSIDELTREAKASMASEGPGLACQRVARQLSNLGMGLDMTDASRAREEVERREQAAAAAAVPDFVPYTPAPSMLDGVGEDGRFWLGLLGGTGVLGVGGLGAREVLRRRPRTCGKCNVLMHRLAEDLDDQHLKDGEKAEERLRSVDYDIWACGTCGSVLKTRWGAIFSSFSKCTSCSWKTMKSSSRTITSATTSSTGLAEVTESCSHCSHHRKYTTVIPRVTKSSSSGSSSGGGGYSSGRGSSGSW